MTYDPATYWTIRGETYEDRFLDARYAEQVVELADVLSGLRFQSVLDVGCGFGRIGGLIRGLRPTASYTGIDFSTPMLARARRNLAALGADVSLIESSLADFEPDRTYDLVIAVEVLMHIPPADIEASVRKLRRLSARHVVTVDWTEPIDRPAMPHNFRHDYQALLAPDRTVPVGLQSIHVVSCAS